MFDSSSTAEAIPLLPQESQIYNRGIKKDTSLDGIGRGTDDRISYGISSDVSSNPSIPQSAEKSTASAKKVAENSSKNSRRASMDITPEIEAARGSIVMDLSSYKPKGRKETIE